MLDNETIDELKEQLLSQKERFEKELGDVGKENPHAVGGFDAKWEDLGANEEDNAVEVAQYESNLAVGRELEMALNEVRAALARMDEGSYGVCANCGQDINPARLKVKPEAVYCIQCSEKLQR